MSTRAFVERSGARLKDLAPTGVIAALIAAACMPVVYPLLGQVPESAKAAVELLGATGGAYLTEFVKDVIGRLRGRDGAPRSRDPHDPGAYPSRPRRVRGGRGVVPVHGAGGIPGGGRAVVLRP
ncbi:MAG: hypothetical protein ACRDZ4_22910 [Egibacteraceae bacterium]